MVLTASLYIHIYVYMYTHIKKISVCGHVCVCMYTAFSEAG